jgi:hypothetical protein
MQIEEIELKKPQIKAIRGQASSGWVAPKAWKSAQCKAVDCPLNTSL